MNMILITLSMFIAVVIIQTHIRGDRKNKVPPWLKRVSALLSLFLCKYTVSQRKYCTKLMPITLSVLNVFSKVFHCWKEK